jgi:hypothetical protein
MHVPKGLSPVLLLLAMVSVADGGEAACGLWLCLAPSTPQWRCVRAVAEPVCGAMVPVWPGLYICCGRNLLLPAAARPLSHAHAHTQCEP